MALEVTGHRLLIRPDEVEKTSEGGILIMSSEYEEKLEKAGQTTGTVISIGPTAFKAFEVGPGGEHIGKPWCKVGDRIQYSRYGGDFTSDPETGEDLLVIADEDVKVVITGEKLDG